MVREKEGWRITGGDRSGGVLPQSDHFGPGWLFVVSGAERTWEICGVPGECTAGPTHRAEQPFTLTPEHNLESPVLQADWGVAASPRIPVCQQFLSTAGSIERDTPHLLTGSLAAPSGRRFTVPAGESRCCKNSFEPAAIRAVNKRKELGNWWTGTFGLV